MSSKATALGRIIKSIGHRTWFRNERSSFVVRPTPARHSSSSTIVSQDRLALELLKALRTQLAGPPESKKKSRVKGDVHTARSQDVNKEEHEKGGDLDHESDIVSAWAAQADSRRAKPRKTEQTDSSTPADIFEEQPSTFVVHPRVHVPQDVAPKEARVQKRIASPAQPEDHHTETLSAELKSIVQIVKHDAQALRPVLPSAPEIIAAEEERRRHTVDVQLEDLSPRIDASPEIASRLYTKQVESMHPSRTKDSDADSLDGLWQHSVSLITGMTSNEPDAYKEITQVLRAAQGWRLSLAEEPNDIILRVFEHTNCSMQIDMLAQGDSRCTGYSLTGNRSQIADALALLEEWEAIKLVASAEEADPPTGDGYIAETLDLDPGLIRRTLPRGLPWVEEKQVKTFIEGARDRITLPPMLLSAAVEALITSQAWLPDHSVRGSEPTVVADAITALLCEASNVPSTSTATLSSAFTLLSKQKLYKHVQAIQDAHDRKAGFRVLSTAPCNVLLENATLHRDLRAFRSILRYMSKRSIGADPETWTHFFRITAVLLPDQLDTVRDLISKCGVLHTESVRLCLLQDQMVSLLRQKIDNTTEELPSTFIKDFVAELTSTYGSRWLRRDMTCTLLDFLLPRGYWKEAFEVCDAMLKQGHALKLRVLSRFLRGAGLDKYRGIDRVVQVLDRFDAFLRPRGTPRPAGGVQTKHLVKLTVHEYDVIFKIARTNKSWNVLRAVWQHACCHGKVSTDMRLRMAQSLQGRDLPYALHVMGVGEHEARPRDPKTAASAWRRDEAAYGQVMPINPLAKDVRAGRALDLEWKKTPKRNSTRVWPSAQAPGKQPRITIPVKAARETSHLEDSNDPAV